MKKIFGFLTKNEAKNDFKGTPEEKIACEAIDKNEKNGFSYFINSKAQRLEPVKRPKFFELIKGYAGGSEKSFLVTCYEDYECYRNSMLLHSVSPQSFERSDIINKNTKEDGFISKIHKHRYNKKRADRFKKFIESNIYKNNQEIMNWTRKNMIGVSFYSISKKSGHCHKFIKKSIEVTGFKVITTWYKKHLRFQQV
jgi:hypothetical protein